ncbi:DUF4097 family beta strand repeat-containing protein [Deinococcus radiotolerans]|uniref:DUF4097 domain-containing protein n=1 Tax=Deinococcus radiotolerans TaxID=1309407 RepID=A0ABQ2FFP2_9DEIO|nr:DUF4097 family beta strand repeat-containing protein [Deinococcus radiotolerans]GGK93824.1 hypothetical protein GCM10010844_10450 [Deinococcus radiotolerans]
MTSVPASRPLGGTLGRMAWGLLIAAAGGALMWLGSARTLTPGMSVQDTPISVHRDGPLPLDLAGSAAVTVSGDRADLTVTPLPGGTPYVLRGLAHHRARNPVQAEVTRQGRSVSARLTLNVQPLRERGMIIGGPEGVQHALDVALSRDLPVTLSTATASGQQRLNLTPLRLRALTVRSDSGDLTLNLPGRESGAISVVSRSGPVTLSAPTGSRTDALRVNTSSGNQHLNLAGQTAQTLGIGTDSGDIQLTLPVLTGRGTVTTGSGDIRITATSHTRGNLDIRTQSGHVTLLLPPGLTARVRYPDRDTDTFPADQPPSPAPDLDVFVDAGRSRVTVTTRAAPEPPTPPAPTRMPTRP